MSHLGHDPVGAPRPARRETAPRTVAPGRAAPAALDARTDLRADCPACAGLCCVGLTLVRSADFPIDKPAGAACPNLAGTRCAIHDRLRPSGFAGCVAYDCHGAGQRITALHAGRDWRTDPDAARAMFALLPRLAHVHELLRFLLEARELCPSDPDLDDAVGRTERLALASPDELLGFDAGAHHRDVVAVLRGVSEEVRAARAGDAPTRDLGGADLVGADLRGADLFGANLRGALAVGADLRGADLRWADLAGADLRGARLHGADLRDVLFCTRSQLEAALGDARTQVPARLGRPAHWRAGAGPGPRAGLITHRSLPDAE